PQGRGPGNRRHPRQQRRQLRQAVPAHLITSSQQGGGLNADTLFRTGPYSNSYSSWTLDAATIYYRNTGDTSFARQILPWLEGQLAYDWDFYDGAKTSTVTSFNDLYYQSLRDVAYIEASLGNT